MSRLDKSSTADARELGLLRAGFRAGYAMAKPAFAFLLVVAGARGWGATGNLPTAPDQHNCRYSDQIHDSYASLMREKIPTHFTMMTSRYVAIVQAAHGYHCSGSATVAFDGHNYFQAGITDDPGMAELVPTISSWTGMSLANAFDLIVFTVIALGVLIGYAGFGQLYPNQPGRWVGAAVFLCLGLAEAKVADVYVFQTSPLIAGIPWVLHFALSRRFAALNVSAILLAFCCSWCSLVRTGTTLICMAFLVTLFVTRRRVQEAFLPLLLIILACVPSMIFERYLIARRDTILAGLGETATAVNSHPIWHSIYIGLGFVPNSEVPEYNDAVAVDKVRSIDPAAPYTSAKYEHILRHEVLSIARRRPILLIENLAAKTGIVILWVLILLFPARRLLFTEREVFWLDASFVFAIALSAMNAILVIPRRPYMLTFLCLTFLYSSVKLCRALSIEMELDAGTSRLTSLMGWRFSIESRVRR